MTQCLKRKRAKSRQFNAPAPFKQGMLDGLCGIYAAVNAIRILWPQLDEDEVTDLFHALLKSLPGRGIEVEDRIAFGIEPLALPKVLRAAKTFLRNVCNVRLTVQLLNLERQPSLRSVWNALQAHTSEPGVAIIGLTGMHDHWTVVRNATKRTLQLSDSGDLAVLCRRFCSITRGRRLHANDPATVFLLSVTETRLRL